MLKTVVFFVIFGALPLCSAEVQVYKSTDNTGINKKEQIDGIEKYLATLSAQLNSLEQKIDASAAKIKGLEGAVASIKDNDIRKIQEQIAPKPTDTKTVAQKASASEEELEKIKADVLSIKNTDVEQIRLDINALRFSVKNLETILKVPGK